MADACESGVPSYSARRSACASIWRTLSPCPVRSACARIAGEEIECSPPSITRNRSPQLRATAEYAARSSSMAAVAPARVSSRAGSVWTPSRSPASHPSSWSYSST